MTSKTFLHSSGGYSQTVVFGPVMPAEHTRTSILPKARSVARAARVHRRGVGDVERVHGRGLAQRRAGGVQRGRVAVPQGDACAAGDEPLRDRVTDAGSAAGDDRRAAFEVESIHRAIRPKPGS